jgi:hypothetical protein
MQRQCATMKLDTFSSDIQTQAQTLPICILLFKRFKKINFGMRSKTAAFIFNFN